MNDLSYKLDSKNFPYLSESEIRRINEGFELLNIVVSEDYPGAVIFSRRFEKPSVLTSEGINYTLTSSSGPVLNK